MSMGMKSKATWIAAALWLLLAAGLLAGCGVDPSPMASASEEGLAPAGTSLLTFGPGDLEPAGKKVKRSAAEKGKEEDDDDDDDDGDGDGDWGRRDDDGDDGDWGRRDDDGDDGDWGRRDDDDDGDVTVVSSAIQRAEEEGCGNDAWTAEAYSAWANQVWDEQASEKIGPRGGKLRLKARNGQGGNDDIKVVFTVPEGALDCEVEICIGLRGATLNNLEIGFAPTGQEFNIPAELKVKVGKDALGLEPEEIEVIHHHGNELEEVEISELVEGRKDIELVIKVPGFSRYSMGGGE
jgi:hypothetical protein